MFFEPIVQIGFGGFISSRDKALRGAVREEPCDLGLVRIEFTFPWTPRGRPNGSPCALRKRSASVVRCEMSSRSISAAMENAIAMILLCIL